MLPHDARSFNLHEVLGERLRLKFQKFLDIRTVGRQSLIIILDAGEVIEM